MKKWASKLEYLAHEIDCMIRKRETPWLSFTNIKHRYMVVESSCHDTYIAEAFAKLDYEMKMHTSCANFMLPYDLITEEKVQEQCRIFEAVESGKMSLREAIRKLKNIGFVDVDTDNALWQKSYNDKKRYCENFTKDKCYENLVSSGLTVRGKLMGLDQDQNGKVWPNVMIYIDAFDKYSNGEDIRKTSNDTEHLKSMYEYLASLPHLKEAFQTVWCVTLLFPIIEHLIREGKKMTFCDVCLENYRPPKTPRRAPTAIIYGYESTRPDKFIVNVFGGVQLTHQQIKVKKINYTEKKGIELCSLMFGVLNQSEEEREMYASAISNLKEPRSDVHNSVHPDFIQDVLDAWSRPKSKNNFVHEYLGYKPPTKKEPEKLQKKIPEWYLSESYELNILDNRYDCEVYKKNKCCVVM